MPAARPEARLVFASTPWGDSGMFYSLAMAGLEPDDVVTGRKLSGLRLRAGIGLRRMALAMDISHSYLCLLEKGERRWSEGLKRDYHWALNNAEVSHSRREKTL